MVHLLWRLSDLHFCFLCMYLYKPNPFLILNFYFHHYRLAELDFAVSQKLDIEVSDSLEYEWPKRKQRSRYNLAKKYFDVKEYSR